MLWLWSGSWGVNQGVNRPPYQRNNITYMSHAYVPEWSPWTTRLSQSCSCTTSSRRSISSRGPTAAHLHREAAWWRLNSVLLLLSNTHTHSHRHTHSRTLMHACKWRALAVWPEAVPVMWLWECRWDLCLSDCNNRDQMGTCGQNCKPGAERSGACLSLFLFLFMRISFTAFLFIISEDTARTDEAPEKKKKTSEAPRTHHVPKKSTVSDLKRWVSFPYWKNDESSSPRPLATRSVSGSLTDFFRCPTRPQVVHELVAVCVRIMMFMYGGPESSTRVNSGNTPGCPHHPRFLLKMGNLMLF